MSNIKDKLQQQREEVARKRAAAQELARQQKEGAKFARDELARQREAAKLAERALREERKKEQQVQKDMARLSIEEGRKLREEAAAERKAKREEDSQRLRALLRRQQEAREAEIASMGGGTTEVSPHAPEEVEDDDDGGLADMDAHLQMALDAAQNALLDDPDMGEEVGLEGGLEGSGDDGTDVSSVNSKDLADDAFMEGFREEVLGPRIAELQEEIALLKKEAVRLMKDMGDKPAALDALRRAKQMELELADLQKSP